MTDTHYRLYGYTLYHVTIFLHSNYVKKYSENRSESWLVKYRITNQIVTGVYPNTQSGSLLSVHALKKKQTNKKYPTAYCTSTKYTDVPHSRLKSAEYIKSFLNNSRALEPRENRIPLKRLSLQHWRIKIQITELFMLLKRWKKKSMQSALKRNCVFKIRNNIFTNLTAVMTTLRLGSLS